MAWTQRLKGLQGSIQRRAPTLYLANRCVGKMPPLCIKLLVQTFKPGLSLRQARPSGRQAAGMTFAGLHCRPGQPGFQRSEEHTSELQSLMRISYAVFCLKKQRSKLPTDRSYRHTRTDTESNIHQKP